MKLFVIIVMAVIVIFSFCEQNSAQIASLEATFRLVDINGMSVSYQNGFPVPAFEKQPRVTIVLAGSWRKERFTANHDLTLSKRDSAGYANLIQDAGDRYKPDYDDQSWQAKNIPGVENQMKSYEKTPEYFEDGVWYRRRFTVPDSLRGSLVKLMFYAVNYVTDVWLNGSYLGYHEGGYTPFAFNVSKVVNYDGENVLAVRVDNPPWGKRQDIVPFYEVDWFNYAGIIHDVYLEFSHPISVIRADVVPIDKAGNVQTRLILYNTSSNPAEVQVTLEVFNAEINPTNIATEQVSDLIGQPAAISGITTTVLTAPPESSQVWQTNIKIENARQWTPSAPNLYILKVTLTQSGKTSDEFYTQFGIRTVETAGDKVLLDGVPVFFTGIARHEDSPDYGRSLPIEQIFQDLKIVKSMNVNLLRTAHYPNHPYTYLIADRLGLAIMEEIPVWWFDQETPWLIQNTLRHIHQQMWREMIFRDYNRPSILLWSTCNECLDVPNRTSYIETVKNDLRTNYDDRRLVTQSAAADRPGPNDPSQQACDVAGWTMYFGIFHGGTYYEGTKNFLEAAHLSYPDKPILNTEFGYWSGENRTLMNTQVVVCNATFGALKEKAVMDAQGNYNPAGYLMASTWWCIFDWYSSGHPNGFQSMGVYQMNRTSEKAVATALRQFYQPYSVNGGLVSAIQNSPLESKPANFILEQNYPNPFNPSTQIRYHLPRAGSVRLSIFDLQGRETKVLIDEWQSAGVYTVFFEADQFASGIYFYRLQIDGKYLTRKMLIIH
jgi:beta-galactosidase